MSYSAIEILTSYIIGIILIILSCWIFKLKIKGFTRLLINAVLGGLLLFLMNLFGIMTLPLNPLNALIAGFLGVFGVAVIYLIVIFA